ncbi:hypothetical protein O181_028620 [Austropuccinia psidii MF-1]|uniref:Integrase catalytic domain-containing protein n=1 Tax=Austropuccinia psidii MF-1 TaxID=1389203 RepID=A0A9Q3H4D2_9BASI|nr:hypothetical protein [Austropuccinia psidii MF-1]
MPEGPINVKDSSSDEEVIKTRLLKLTRTNWVQWSCQFENYLISKGMDDLLEPPSQDVKETAKLKKKNSAALTLLWASVSTEFEGILLNNKSSFHECWTSLGNCCGKNSVVVICRTLHKLINLKYEPATSLEKHIDDFHKIYASYLSISADSTDSMNLSPSMAAAFFLQSLDNDKELSSLCQTLYDIRPFNINSVTDRVALEHSRRQSAYDHHALLFDKNKQDESSKAKPKNPAEAGRKKKGFKDKRKGRTNNQNSNNDNDTNKRIERIEKLLERLQASNNISSVNVTSEPKEPTRQNTSDSEAFILDEVNAMIPKQNHGVIYLDSGAGRTVVNDRTLLTDPTPVNKQINTFSTPVKVTHQGTLNFKGIKLYPVYYVSNGPANLLSVAQLCDHELKLTMKSNLFIVKYKNRIIDVFRREGNLFVSRLPLISVYRMPNVESDWHLTLGHPSDSYLKTLLKEQKIKVNFTQSSLCQGYRYVLVLVDDFRRFNRIFLLSEKGQAEERIKAYLMEIKNNQGISLERGPPQSPQTNGVAERFNQTLLYKIRCLLGQSNIPTAYWDEEAIHASLLLNMLPHKHLNMKSPTMALKEVHSLIEPEVDFARLVPYSDGLGLLNLETGKIRVSRDYQPVVGAVMPSMHQPLSKLPTSHSVKVKLRIPVSRSPSPNQIQDTSCHDLPNPASTAPVMKKLKNYDYVPYYKEAPKDITSSISKDNIVLGKRNARNPDQLLLTDVVPYSQAISDPIEGTEWKKAMDTKFESLQSHNTGELVPYPEKPTKVIGGMWRLTRKRNEWGEVYRQKARWVVLGNHQEHMLHYYETWASVGRNETLKVMLSLAVNFKYISYQFDIKTAFLHGEMDAVVHVKQVKGYEEKGKESWVWRLKKSLYGTKQAPRMWKSKLTTILNDLGLTSTQSDESLFTNSEKTLLLHVHVDDGFIISRSEEKISEFLTKLNSILKLKFKKNPTQHLGYTLK